MSEIDRKKEAFSVIFLLFLMTILTCALYRMHLFGPYVYIFRDAGSDTFNSYWPVMEYLVRHIQAGDLHFWMFQSGFGNSVISVLHFLADPFSLLLLLFPKDTMAMGLVWVIACKTISGGILFYFFSRELRLSRIISMITAILWAFSGFMVLWGQHYFFANVMPLFALLMLGMARLLHQKSGKLFVLALWLAFVNFIYFAVWFTIAVIMIALLCYLLQSKKSLRHFFCYAWMFFWRGCLAFLLSAFRTIPEIYSMIGTARLSGGTVQTGLLATKQELFDAIIRFFSNNSLGITLTQNALGFNYYEQITLASSILALCFLIHNLVVRKGRQRLFCAVTGLLILFSLCTKMICILMNVGKGSSYRWSFLIIFALIVNLGFALQDISMHFAERGKLLLTEGLLSILILSSSFLILKKTCGPSLTEEELLQVQQVWFGLALFLAAYIGLLLFLFFLHRFSISGFLSVKEAGIVLLLLVSAEVFVLNNPTINDRIYMWKNSVYSSEYYDPQKLQPIEQISSLDDGLYRMEKDYRVGLGNDPLLMGYYGTTTYGMESAGIQQMLEENGLFWNEAGVGEVVYGHPALESVLGIRYMIASDTFAEEGYERITEIPDGTGRFIYQNKNALPLIYTADVNSAAAIDAVIHGGMLTDQTYPVVNGLTITSFQDDLIIGTIDATADSALYTSITYDAGWHVYADGEKMQTMPVYSGFLGATVPAGTHEIRLSFFPVGLGAGILISIGSTILMLLFLILSRKRNHQIT